MNYEINVSRHGNHLFATHERSLMHEEEARSLLTLFRLKFPAKDGYQITCRLCRKTSESVNF